MPTREQIRRSRERNRKRGVTEADIRAMAGNEWTPEQIAQKAREQRDNPYPTPPQAS
jgi:hypothetical protein